MTESRYKVVETITSKEEADAFIASEVVFWTGLTCAIAPIKEAEASKIARTAAVAYIAQHRPDLLSQIEILFQRRNPFE
jgi:hypothetical protein